MLRSSVGRNVMFEAVDIMKPVTTIINSLHIYMFMYYIILYYIYN